MEQTISFLISIVVALIIILLGVIFLSRKGKKDFDYYAMFVMGLTWLPLGIIINNIAFISLGIIFMVLGLTNKDKWEKRKKLSEMNAKEKILAAVGMSVLTVTLAAGVIFFLLFKYNIIK